MTNETTFPPFAIRVDVPAQTVADTFCAAVEGGYSDWCHGIERIAGPDVPNYYAEPRFWSDPEAKVAVKYDDPNKPEGNGKGKVTITHTAVRNGLNIMAAKYPRHFADMIGDGGDAITGDVLLQCVVLGEVVYG